MKTGSIKIISEEGKTPSVEIELVNRSLWLDKYGTAKLFNCFPQRIEANLRSIFKSGLLRESEVTCNYRYVFDGQERQRLYYSLEVLIFLSYRLDTPEAGIFRSFINSALYGHLQKSETFPTCQSE